MGVHAPRLRVARVQSWPLCGRPVYPLRQRKIARGDAAGIMRTERACHARIPDIHVRMMIGLFGDVGDARDEGYPHEEGGECEGLGYRIPPSLPTWKCLQCPSYGRVIESGVHWLPRSVDGVIACAGSADADPDPTWRTVSSDEQHAGRKADGEDGAAYHHPPPYDQQRLPLGSPRKRAVVLSHQRSVGLRRLRGATRHRTPLLVAQ